MPQAPDRDPAAEAAPAMKAYATRHGLAYDALDSIPNVTQLLRRDWFSNANNVLSWETGSGPTGPLGRLGHFSYRRRGPGDHFEDAWFTVLALPAPASVGFATRILCYDRRLDSDAQENPDADEQYVALDDEAVRLESDAFLARYRLVVDHDQSRVAVWQLFSPEVVEWLTASAPEGMSLELQPGVLCCFLPGVRSDDAALDALREAADVLAERIAGIGPQPEAQTAPGTRGEMVERELAAHPFTEPPVDVQAAAREFRRWRRLDDRAWHLGAEAFFRAYVSSIGMRPMAVAELRATHYEAGLVGDPVRAAAGVLPGTSLEGWLVFANLQDADDSGWIEILADSGLESNTYAFVGTDDHKRAEKLGIDVNGTASTICMWQDDHGERGRTLAGVTAFMDFAAPALERFVAAALKEG